MKRQKTVHSRPSWRQKQWPYQQLLWHNFPPWLQPRKQPPRVLCRLLVNNVMTTTTATSSPSPYHHHLLLLLLLLLLLPVLRNNYYHHYFRACWINCSIVNLHSSFELASNIHGNVFRCSEMVSLDSIWTVFSHLWGRAAGPNSHLQHRSRPRGHWTRSSQLCRQITTEQDLCWVELSG